MNNYGTKGSILQGFWVALLTTSFQYDILPLWTNLLQIFEGKTYVQIDDDNCSYNLIVNSTEDDVWQDIVDQLVG
jgi:hypothetical protein